MVLFNLISFLHFIGLAFGLGGVTCVTIISLKAEKDKENGRKLASVIPAISKLIWLGLFLLIFSGIYLTSYLEESLNIQMLLIKHILVVWIVIFGVLIMVNSKKAMRLAPKQGEKPIHKYLVAKRFAKVFSRMNLVLWYLTALISFWI